jgi:hypothetical protein
MKSGLGDTEDAAQPTRIISSVPTQTKYAAPDNRTLRYIHTAKIQGNVINSIAAEKPPNMQKTKAAKRRLDKLPGLGPSAAIQLK